MRLPSPQGPLCPWHAQRRGSSLACPRCMDYSPVLLRPYNAHRTHRFHQGRANDIKSHPWFAVRGCGGGLVLRSCATPLVSRPRTPLDGVASDTRPAAGTIQAGSRGVNAIGQLQHSNAAPSDARGRGWLPPTRSPKVITYCSAISGNTARPNRRAKLSRGTPLLLARTVQDFDWETLAARKLEPPRRPKESDYSKRKAELEEAHRGSPLVPAMTPQEAAEADKVRGRGKEARGRGSRREGKQRAGVGEAGGQRCAGLLRGLVLPDPPVSCLLQHLKHSPGHQPLPARAFPPASPLDTAPRSAPFAPCHPPPHNADLRRLLGR